MAAQPLTIEHLDDGAIWRVALGGSKGNVLDATLTDAIADVYREAVRTKELRAICLEGQGSHFSFGASVAEHLPGEVQGMLRRFHEMILTVVDSSVMTLAAVRGQCLGGGLELVSVCNRVFAHRDAKLGQPEIVLGVLAPVASVVLSGRVGRANAEDLCLTGRTVSAADGLAMGLVDEVPDGDPMEAALAYARTHLLPKSAASLRFAVRAVRTELRTRLLTDLPALERLYLDELMATADAEEGLRAFLEKRQPLWRNA